MKLRRRLAWRELWRVEIGLGRYPAARVGEELRRLDAEIAALVQEAGSAD